MLRIGGNSMQKTLLAKQIYSGLLDILHDKEYYYTSQVGSDFNKLTDEGQKIVAEYIQNIAPTILKVEDADFKERVRNFTWDNLKK